jgi:hypothetical protein
MGRLSWNEESMMLEFWRGPNRPFYHVVNR